MRTKLCVLLFKLTVIVSLIDYHSNLIIAIVFLNQQAYYYLVNWRLPTKLPTSKILINLLCLLCIGAQFLNISV